MGKNVKNHGFEFLWGEEPQDESPFIIKHWATVFLGETALAAMLMHFNMVWLMVYFIEVGVTFGWLVLSAINHIDPKAALKCAREQVTVYTDNANRWRFVFEAAAEETMTSPSDWTGKVEIVGVAAYFGEITCRLNITLLYRGRRVVKMLDVLTKDFKPLYLPKTLDKRVRADVSRYAHVVLRAIREKELETTKKEEPVIVENSKKNEKNEKNEAEGRSE